jgi:chromosome partitioning protein
MAKLTISVALLKGGASKTTTAVALAEAAALGGPTLLVDTDPQGGAVRWAALAEQAGRPLNATVIGDPAGDLARRLPGLSRDYIVAVIDAPPPGALRNARDAIAAAGRVVMPVPPQLADLDRVPPTAAIAAEYGIPARAVLTQVRAGLAEHDAAAAALRSWGVSTYETELPLTVWVQRAYGQAVTGGPLLKFGAELLAEILEEVTVNA